MNWRRVYVFLETVGEYACTATRAAPCLRRCERRNWIFLNRRTGESKNRRMQRAFAAHRSGQVSTLGS